MMTTIQIRDYVNLRKGSNQSWEEIKGSDVLP